MIYNKIVSNDLCNLQIKCKHACIYRYVVLQRNKSKENLITVQNSVVTVYLIIKGCNYCSVKVIKLWCQKDREGGILLEGTWSYLICTFVSPIFKGVLLSYGFLLKAMPITSSFLTLQQKFKVKYNKACCPQT